MKNPLTWELVPEDALTADAPEGYVETFFPPAKNVLIDAEHPQVGLFPPHFDDYMQYWPENIERPVSIVILQNKWEWSTFYNRYEGTVETEPDFGPETVLTMPNGATFTLREIDPSGDEAPEEIFEGDWSAYGVLGSDEINAVIDVVTEAYALSD
jgi:hypothetical protein